MKLSFEKAYPLGGGFLISLIYLFYIRPLYFPSSICNLLTAVVSISAIAIGFLATSKSILFTIQNRRVIKQIKKMDLYNILIDYMMSAIHFCFLLALLSAVGLFLDENNPPSWLPWAFSVWLFLGTTAMLSCYRVITIFSKILRTEP